MREQHAVPGGINSLFALSLQSRLKMFMVNPLFADSLLVAAPSVSDTPNQSFATPISASTPFNGLKEESTLFEDTMASTVPRAEETVDASVRAGEHQSVDMIVENPLFGSGLRLKKVLFALFGLIRLRKR